MSLDLSRLELEGNATSEMIALIAKDLQPLITAVSNKATLGENPERGADSDLAKLMRVFLARPEYQVRILSVGEYCDQRTSAFSFLSRSAIAEGLWATLLATDREALPHLANLLSPKVTSFLSKAEHLNGGQLFDYICTLGAEHPNGPPSFFSVSPKRLPCGEMLHGIVLRQIGLRMASGVTAVRRAEAGYAIIDFLSTHPCLGVMHDQDNREPIVVFASR